MCICATSGGVIASSNRVMNCPFSFRRRLCHSSPIFASLLLSSAHHCEAIQMRHPGRGVPGNHQSADVILTYQRPADVTRARPRHLHTNHLPYASIIPYYAIISKHYVSRGRVILGPCSCPHLFHQGIPFVRFQSSRTRDEATPHSAQFRSTARR